MEILRVSGLVLLALCCVAAGGYAGAKSKRSKTDLETLYRLVAHIRREIVYERTELADCFRGFVGDDGAAGFFISGDYDRALAGYALDRRMKNELTSFFSKLGSGFADEEEKRCDRILSLMKETLDRQNAELPGKTRVYVTLGVCAGAVLLLLFL